ncbi:MAG: hypothetical protein JSV81_12430 [Anaerolineales bacterium]|nr:MAG: hypothetical protein JSV81_12430 [Anaerolineales bacterium]
MSFQDLMGRLLTEPRLADLLALQTRLLAAEADPERTDAAHRALDVAREFHTYLSEIEAKSSAREYSELASLLDVGAVGGVALENLAEAGQSLLQRMLLGGLSETLMVLASRQYVKAWHREMRPIHVRAAWFLRDQLWRLSVMGRPDMSTAERVGLVDGLLGPALDDTTSDEVRAALLGRLFQVVLIIHLARALSG